MLLIIVYDDSAYGGNADDAADQPKESHLAPRWPSRGGSGRVA
jgi:hypothetical protein